VSDEARVALVTGGARMGRAIGEVLAARGFAVAYSAHGSREALAGVADDLRARGVDSRVFDADLRQPGACVGLIDAVLAWRGRLDVLICLASIFEKVPLDAVTPAVWEAHRAIDLDASLHCARAAAPGLRASGDGQIILSADWVAASGRPRYVGYVPYYVAKAGLVALTEALALELARDGTRVNAIAPGPILPAAGTTPEQQAAVMAATPLGHWGHPQGLAETIAGLLDASVITGQVVRVDGGRHLT